MSHKQDSPPSPVAQEPQRAATTADGIPLAGPSQNNPPLASPQLGEAEAKDTRTMQERLESVGYTFTSLVPEGWVLVPREPTKAMFNAARDYWKSVNAPSAAWPCGEAMGIYAAMIAAASPPPEGDK